MSTLNFDASQVEPATDFEPMPAGKYSAVVIESSDKKTKAGDGSFLEAVFEIIDGPFRGRKVWHRFNLANRNSTAVEIARQQLSSLCRAVGVLQPRDSAELHNLPLVIRLSQKAGSDGMVRNEIKGFARREAVVAAAAAAPQTKPAGKPWGR